MQVGGAQKSEINASRADFVDYGSQIRTARGEGQNENRERKKNPLAQG
jgi:hypothetical protein